MATLIKASRIDSLICFTTLDKAHGRSRKLFVRADALWHWLNDLCDALPFSATDYGDALRFAHGPDDVVLAQFTTWNYTDNDGHIAGFTHLADLPHRFFADLFEEGEARFVTYSAVSNQLIG